MKIDNQTTIEVRDVQEIPYRQYREHPALNQSYLKQVYSDPRAAKEGKVKENAGMYLGSAVDAMVFNTFEDEYIMGTEIAPSDNIKSILEYCYRAEPSELLDSHILEGAHEYNYGQSWKAETLIKKVREGGNKDSKDGETYFNFLKRADGKTIIAHEDYDQAKFISNQIEAKYGYILSNASYQKAFVGTLYIDDKKLCQVKVLFDILKNNNDVYDLKVVYADLRWFAPMYYLGYSYYVQSSLYYLFVEALGGSSFTFLAINKDYPEYGALYNVPEEYLIKGITGFKRKGRDYPGLIELIKTVHLHQQYGFEAPVDIILNPKRNIELTE